MILGVWILCGGAQGGGEGAREEKVLGGGGGIERGESIEVSPGGNSGRVTCAGDFCWLLLL